MSGVFRLGSQVCSGCAAFLLAATLCLVAPGSVWADEGGAGVPPPPGCSANCNACTFAGIVNGNPTCNGNCNKPGGTNCSICAGCTAVLSYVIDENGNRVPTYYCPCA